MFHQSNKNEYTGTLTLLNQQTNCLNIGKQRYIGIEIFNSFENILKNNKIKCSFTDYLENDLKIKLNNIKTYYHNNYYNAFDVVDALADITFNESKYPKEIYILGSVLFYSLTNIGLIPLIDEVTGYQNVRGSTELRDLFSKIMKEENILTK